MKNFKPNENFDFYLYFICERMNIFWRRKNGESAPYSEDPLFNDHKFTNVYRALDRSSQYLLKNVIYNGITYSKEEMFWRILIYKHFNLPSTWDLLIDWFGDIDKNITLDEISAFLKKKIQSGIAIYSNAYMMTSAFLSGKSGKYCHLKKNKWNKHEYYFYIFKQELIKEGKLEGILNAVSLEEMFNKMYEVTSFGEFTSYQYIQDLNYTEFFDFDDNGFCSAGVGTQRGIRRTFDIEGVPDFQEIIKWVHANFEDLLEQYGYEFKGIPGHKPTIADLSNCFLFACA